MLLGLYGCVTPPKDVPVMPEKDIAAAKAVDLTVPCEFAYGRDYKLLYRFHAPALPLPRVKYPLVIFLHGSGERGSDNAKTLVHGVEPICKYALRHGDAYVIVPQCPDGKKWVDQDWSKSSMKRPQTPTQEMSAVLALIDDICLRYPIDMRRIYITGISMGGFGTWDAVMRRPAFFAAAIPICGGVDERAAELCLGTDLWFFHGDKDNAVNVEYSRRMHKALNDAWIDHGYTEYPGVGHDCWTRTYKDNRVLGWMFSRGR